MVSSQLLRALAILGITLTHSQPGQPAGRGKIERFFRTVREQFLVELAVPGALAAVGDLARLNELFAGWVETVYHARVHSETGQRPLERFLAAGPPTLPTAQMLHEAFLWSQPRTVTKTATISLHGNRYEVDAALVGRRVEVVLSGSPDALPRRGPLRTGRAGFPRTSAQASPMGVAGDGVGFLRLRARRLAVAGDVHEACSVPVRLCRSPVVGEVVGGDRPAGRCSATIVPTRRGIAGAGRRTSRCSPQSGQRPSCLASRRRL